MEKTVQITQESFNVLSRIRRSAALGEPQQLHARLRGVIDGMRSAAADQGIATEVIDDITYAIVACADEIAMSKPDPVFSYWTTNLLQALYFRESSAGAGFFVRLDRLRRDPRGREALLAYYLCIRFGFRGRYAMEAGGDAELVRLAGELRNELGIVSDLRALELSPSAERPEGKGLARRRGLSLPLIAAAAVIFAGLVFVGFRWSLSTRAQAVAERVQKATADPAKTGAESLEGGGR